MRAWKEKGRGVYGARKVWRGLAREEIEVARCTVGRLMREPGICGAPARRKRPRTAVSAGPGQERPSDLPERDFAAPAPNRRRVADIAYVETAGGFVYCSFILDLLSRKIVGWQVSDSLRAELALDALEMAVWSRGDRIGENLVRHSDRGVQYTSIRYAERLGEISAVRSVGSKGDSCGNAAAEALNSLYEKELIERDGPWSGVPDVMLATLEWVAWYNRERLHSACGYVPPGEFEENYYASRDTLVN
jgi:putative transposase